MNMTPEQAEKLLRKAPRPLTPPGLLETLKSQIDLPRPQSEEPRFYERPSFFRRWLPALSVALWLVACVVILGVQSNLLIKLKAENAALRAAAERTDAANQDQSRLKRKDELTRLRADNDEVRKLRAEVSELNERLKQLETLRAQNRRLLAEASAAPGTSPTNDFIATQAETIERTKCVNNLKQVGLGARMWSNDHQDTMLQTFNEFKQYLHSDKVMFCRASSGTVQYEIISPGVGEEDPAVVYAVCPTHAIVVLVDGSVQQMRGDRKLVVRPDGK